MKPKLGSDSPQTCSFSGFALRQALFAKHGTWSKQKAFCSPGEPLAGRQESPVSSFSLLAKVSGLDADALHCLPSACTSLKVSERKLKVSAVQTWSEAALYPWGWYDGHQAGRWKRGVKSSYACWTKRSPLQGQPPERWLRHKLFSKFQLCNTRKLTYDQSTLQTLGQILISALQHKSRVTF